MCLFEETTRVPLVVAAPGAGAGIVSPRLVELVDVFPTLDDLCGLEQPPDLEGLSFVPLLRNPERPWKKAALTVVSRGKNIDATKELDRAQMGRTVFNGRWRFTQWPDGTSELYDHDSDPYEYINVADRRGELPQREAMKSLLENGWAAARPSPLP